MAGIPPTRYHRNEMAVTRLEGAGQVEFVIGNDHYGYDITETFYRPDWTEIQQPT